MCWNTGSEEPQALYREGNHATSQRTRQLLPRGVTVTIHCQSACSGHPSGFWPTRGQLAWGVQGLAVRIMTVSTIPVTSLLRPLYCSHTVHLSPLYYRHLNNLSNQGTSIVATLYSGPPLYCNRRPDWLPTSIKKPPLYKDRGPNITNLSLQQMAMTT